MNRIQTHNTGECGYPPDGSWSRTNTPCFPWSTFLYFAVGSLSNWRNQMYVQHRSTDVTRRNREIGDEKEKKMIEQFKIGRGTGQSRTFSPLGFTIFEHTSRTQPASSLGSRFWSQLSFWYHSPSVYRNASCPPSREFWSDEPTVSVGIE